jgi:transposase
MANKYQTLYSQVLKEYFENKSSIRKTADRFNIHYQTVYEWIKKYKSSGEKAFFTNNVPHNRISAKFERLIVSYKEKFPYLTVKQARKLLSKKGIRISWHGIWNVWQRYGYCGFDEKNLSNNFTEFISFTPESRRKLQEAERLYESGKTKESAEVINRIPCLPKNELILKLPYEFLNTRRRIEKLHMQFDKIPLAEYIKETKRIYQRCIRNNWNYSALRISMPLLVALNWYGDQKEEQKWTQKIESLFWASPKRARDLFTIYFNFLIQKGYALAHELKIKESIKIAQYCYRMIIQRKKPLYNFMYYLVPLFLYLEDQKTAEKLIKKAMAGVDESRKKQIKTILGIYIYLMKGDKHTAEKLFKEVEIYDWAKDARTFRFQANYSIIDGKPLEALRLTQEALNAAKQANLIGDINHTYITMASAYMSLGETKRGIEILSDLRKYAIKKGMRRHLLATDVLLRKIPSKKDFLVLPSIKLAWLLKNKDYLTSYRFAVKKGIQFFFYRYLFFYPEVVRKRIAKGKPTFLPKTFLGLPIFNTEAISYRINFLGKTAIYRNQEYLKEKIKPKDAGILLYIAHKLSKPQKQFNTTEIIMNFWRNIPNGSKHFSHSLVRIKEALKIPAHYLEIKRQYGESSLISQKLHFFTDYNEFEQTLARAKALEQVGEWEFAKKEYLRAFRLFRGEPFKKNFDNWSMDMRFKILIQFETEAINFTRSCLEHGNENDVRTILQKVLRIIPDSEETKRLLNGLIV